ncbi:MAG: alpha/beta hydrolase [Rhodospirillales bacterium]|nr:MAG: alpha/beta hydrolase [Rhodospirillales bacterium]
MQEPAQGRHRLGPRPLPLHLGLAMWAVTSSSVALPISSSGWDGWKPNLQARARALQEELAAANPEDLGRAVIVDGLRRICRLLAGIEKYRHHPWRRDVADAPTLWRDGSTALRDYGGVGTAALFVPSLINRAYILDLSERHSLLRWLSRNGVNPWLVDWGYPGEAERRFDLDAYIAGRLVRALDATVELTGGPVALVGYCMGGLLALALARLRPQHVTGVALLATPWDFHAGDGARARALAALAPALEPQLQLFGTLPVDSLQMLFAGLDPFGIQRKFEAFAELDPASERARLFVALEDWLNDGIPLAAPVARECLVGWYGENGPARGEWMVAGSPVDPARLDVPALALMPEKDRIVPPQSAAALAAALPRCTALTISAGHIGMVVGSGMRKAVWEPLRRWIAALQK